jgi:prepilin-type N-terminal cleavage/methylation domain-containing protein
MKIFLKNRYSKGFTLVELLVVVAIVGLITVIVFTNYRMGEKEFLLQGAVHQISQDARRVQGMALASRSIGGSVPSGYGIYFNLSDPNQYILFADNDDDGLYGSGDTDIEVLEINLPISLTAISTGSPLSVVFSPPDPSVLISGNPATAETSITLNYEGGGGGTININKVGLIEAE